MNRSISRQQAVNKLIGSVWHTTSHVRFKQIIAGEFIKTSPNISDAERWKTSGGPESFPFVRHIGGLSLFDLRLFEPEAYSSRYPACSWSYFIPAHLQREESIWLEIDHQRLGANFVSGRDLLCRWKEQQAFRHTIMPNIEACSLADVPTDYIKNAWSISKDDAGFKIDVELLRMP